MQLLTTLYVCACCCHASLYVTDVICHPRLAVVLGKESSATLIQSYAGTGNYFCNAVSRSVLAASAELQHFYMQEQSSAAHHIDTITCELSDSAVYKTSLMAAGALDGRCNVQVCIACMLPYVIAYYMAKSMCVQL